MIAISRKSRAFSLIELVVVIVILGVIATIAIPRVSRGAVSAAEASLRQDLAVMRSAIETYRAEHEGRIPELASMPGALLEFTSVTGAVSSTQDSAHPFGPYLSAIPPMKIGDLKGNNTFGAPGDSDAAWHYDEATGDIVANAAGYETY